MSNQSKFLNRTAIFVSVVLFWFSGISLSAPTEKMMPGSRQEENKGAAKMNLPQNHRTIYGTVEGVNESTIKVNAGETGGLIPRYLDLDKLGPHSDSIKKGDRLEITLNNNNAVVDYHISQENH